MIVALKHLIFMPIFWELLKELILEEIMPEVMIWWQTGRKSFKTAK